jgi:hypothetical protein
LKAELASLQLKYEQARAEQRSVQGGDVGHAQPCGWHVGWNLVSAGDGMHSLGSSAPLAGNREMLAAAARASSATRIRALVCCHSECVLWSMS